METLFVGSNIIFLPEVDSTNSYAINLLKNVNLPEGTLVHTAHQTQGRGQRGNLWSSDAASNLTVSIILKPAFLNVTKQFLLYQITALACYDVMAEMLNNSQIDIKIKWPNDILVQKQKIAGILIENTLINQQISASVIGIGVNVNQQHFPEGVNATSLKTLSEKDFEVKDVMGCVCKHLEKWYLTLKNNKLNDIKTAYLQRLYGLNNTLHFETANVVKPLKVEGISENGLLLLMDSSGETKEFDVKEIKWLI